MLAVQTEVRAANTWGGCRSCNTFSLLEYPNNDDDDGDDNNNDSNNDNTNVNDNSNNKLCSIAGLAHRHHMYAMQVSSLQKGLKTASQGLRLCTAVYNKLCLGMNMFDICNCLHCCYHGIISSCGQPLCNVIHG